MIRFYNGKIFILKNGTEITDDEVWVDGSKIVFVGKIVIKRQTEKLISTVIFLCLPLKNAHAFRYDLCTKPCWMRFTASAMAFMI